jgi:hypothetical protein
MENGPTGSCFGAGCARRRKRRSRQTPARAESHDAAGAEPGGQASTLLLGAPLLLLILYWNVFTHDRKLSRSTKDLWQRIRAQGLDARLLASIIPELELVRMNWATNADGCCLTWQWLRRCCRDHGCDGYTSGPPHDCSGFRRRPVLKNYSIPAPICARLRRPMPSQPASLRGVDKSSPLCELAVHPVAR